MFKGFFSKEFTYKTKIGTGQVRSFLEGRYGNISNVVALEEGESSQAFSFNGVDGGYVIRVNRHGIQGFEKDKYAYLHFLSNEIPIPKLVEFGEIDSSYSFGLSRRIENMSVEEFIEAERQKQKDNSKLEIDDIVSLCVGMLDKINRIDISGTTGYGYWTKEGVGQKASWKEFIMSVGKDGWWANMFKTTFLEEGVYNSLHERLMQLVEFCPEDRYLIHGHFGLDTVFTDGKQIVGVIDWAESKYGDFLYDVAWLLFWPGDADFQKVFNRHYSKTVYMNYKQRILCYQLHIAITALSFFAQSMQKDKYEWTKKRMEELLRFSY